MYEGLEHPEISWIENTGYPSYLQEDGYDEDYTEEDAYDEACDRLYEEYIDRQLFGE